MPRGPYWTDVEAMFAAEARAGGHSYAQIADEMIRRFEVIRTEQSVKDSFRRNEKVRAHFLGSAKGTEEVGHGTLTQGDFGPVGTVKANRPHSESEMADLFDINTDKFYAHDIITNQWAKFWQTKIFWRLNLAEAIVHENFDELIKALKAKSVRNFDIDFGKPEGVLSYKMRMIHVPDAHHGALSWGPETGADWDLGISVANHNDAYHTLLDGCAAGQYKDRLICYVLGHDLFHYDRMEGGKVATTFKGTPQDSDGRWQKMFNSVAEMAATQIQYTLDRGHPMHVIVRPGNHDTQTTYYLGKLLEARFWNDNRVDFDVRPVPMQDYQFGRNGFVHLHGDKHGKGKMEKNVKDEFRELWAQSTTFEVHAGHLHHEYVRDESGLLVRGMRALTLNDAWHADAGYGSTRGAQAFDYDYERGLEGIEYYTTPGQHVARKGSGLTS